LDLQEHRLWKFLFWIYKLSFAAFVQISSVDFNSAPAWQISKLIRPLSKYGSRHTKAFSKW
jgi:hypothetical protein